MSKTIPMAIMTAATLFAGVAGAVTRSTAPVKPMIAAPAGKTVARPLARQIPARPVSVALTPRVPVKMTAMRPASTLPAPARRLVSAKLANGKTVTYNCALAGNASKKACG